MIRSWNFRISTEEPLMKNFALLAFLVSFPISIYAQVGSWYQQTVAVDQPVLQDIDMYDSQIGYAAGGVNGTAGFSGVVFTFDGGRNWAPIPDMFFVPTPPPTLIWHAVSVVDPMTIFVAGDSAMIYKSSDGGINWNILTKVPKKYGPVTLRGMFFTDQMNGYVVGGDDALSSPGSPASPPVIFRTSDGGTTWTDESIGLNVIPSNPSIFSIKFASGVWIASANFSTLLINYGFGWSQLPKPSLNPNEGFYDLSAFNANEFVFSGIDWGTNRPKVYETVNGGSRYIPITPFGIPAQIRSFQASHFFSVNYGWVGGTQDYLAVTTNAGTNWTKFAVLGTPVPGTITGMDFLDSLNGWACGGDPGSNRGWIIRYSGVPPKSDISNTQTTATIPESGCEIYKEVSITIRNVGTGELLIKSGQITFSSPELSVVGVTYPIKKEHDQH